MSVQVIHADCRSAIKSIADASIDSIVTDPPYSLVSIQKRFGKAGSAPAKSEGATGVYRRASAGFMGASWDVGETAFDPDWWAEALRVLKPGGHLVAFGGTRTYHRLACAIEDAGFEVRDQLAWTFGAGFPKSHNVGKAIDKAAGAEREVVAVSQFASRKPNGSAGVNSVGLSATPGGFVTAPATAAARQWDGWGTALKPAWEPICLARKPIPSTVAANVLQHGTGALNIDGCRIETEGGSPSIERREAGKRSGRIGQADESPWHEGRRRDLALERHARERPGEAIGRWPANLVHDGSDEVMAEFAKYGETRPGHIPRSGESKAIFGNARQPIVDYANNGYGDTGSAARFFFSAKAGPDDRCDSKHPTVKPVALMRWLARLVTPPGGLVLDPFAGSGTTGVACIREGFDALLIEREADYHKDILHRIAKLSGLDAPLFAGVAG